MNETKIIAATSNEDLKNIADLANLIWHQHFTPLIGENQVVYMLDKFQSYEPICRQVEKEGYEYYFLNFNGENVGYTAFIKKENSMFLSKIYIKEGYRGNKIAKKAIEYMANVCRENALPKIWLTVNRMNLNTIMAYKKMGFEITEEKKSDIGNGYFMDDYIMELKLNKNKANL